VSAVDAGCAIWIRAGAIAVHTPAAVILPDPPEPLAPPDGWLFVGGTHLTTQPVPPVTRAVRTRPVSCVTA
jgi:hypothetical protein